MTEDGLSFLSLGYKRRFHFHHSPLFGSVALGKASCSVVSFPMERPMRQRTKSSCRQACGRAILEVAPPVSVKSSNDAAPAEIPTETTRDLKPGPPS